MRCLEIANNARSRVVATADFGLNFGLSEDGQEHRLEREQDIPGVEPSIAGKPGLTRRNSRSVGDDTTGLPVPGSAWSLRSNTRTPRPRRSIVRQSLHTPGIEGLSMSLNEAARAGSQPPPHAQTDVPWPQERQAGTDSHRAKRRRLSSSLTTPSQQRIAPTRASIAGRRSDRRSGRKAFTTTGGALLGTDTSQTSKIATLEILGSSSSSQENEANKENNTGEAPELRRDLSAARARDTVGLRERTAPSANSISSVNTPALKISKSRGNVRDLDVWEDNKQQEPNDGTTPVPDESSIRPLPSAGSSKPKRRKKRKSVVLVRKKRRSSGPGENQPGQPEVPTPEPDTQASPAPPSSVLTLPPASRRQTRNSLKKDLLTDIGRSPSVSGTPPPKQMEEAGDETYNKESPRELTTPAPSKQTKEDDNDDDESYIQESSPEPTTPAPTTRTKRTSKVGSRRTSSKRDALPSKKGPSKTRFPFLTHRLTNLSRLPTIHETNEDGEHGDDPLDMTNDHGQPNVVDVLAQICRETIENLVEGTSTSRLPSDRAAVKTKRDALEAFGRDLDDELFELSEVVENRIHLEARVRKSRREKASLQAEWLALRKERERIALECDAVRRQHWECEDDARQRWNLSEAAKRAEIELNRDNHNTEDGIEFLLRSVASNVSSASEEGGLLNKVKRFNAQLESMALLLERKRVN
ncbi:hypothetical protein HRR76_000053 [Exophiala dermatitidis]|nr:hypothetical protein HRR76_000053 [Exophiala dermatitidis]